ncbi:acyl transferase domain-containing protein [Kitasatospora sp. GP30]|uniref:type I polyketide synthase n=1 Tax=Kitasatospora sp. GP30 TaxID=3035084 RepID=UPI000C7112CD|nr:type I polyketide synthase [Kitasatospora sp. GP30]MDH6144576.1 acyl transferase domain-containing protein [Kitasatospora sp. GP30]
MNTTDEPIAIIGMGCRFPGAAGVAEFWNLLESNTDAVLPVPADRFDVNAWYDPEPGTPAKLISRHGGFLDEVHGFDAAFFGISPREARTMDPQQRLLLHTVWEAFEDAGIPPASVRGSQTGVFVGQATAEYADAAGDAASADIRTMVGSRLRAVTSGRVSHAFDLRGPSVVLDTACSSALVAVHAARQSLLTGDSDLAIAGGVNVILSPSDAVAYSQGRMLSPDGRCKFGDSSADGFVRSEGVGVIILKRLSDALADGDRIRALLLGSAVTNDGNGSGLLMQPAVSGQAAMLRNAWRSAGVKPAEVDYVEAHGTGTTVGDGVELSALAEALREEGAPHQPLLVGSVKTNIGHAESAAGIAGLIKTVLMAEHRMIPSSLHLDSPHPQLTEPDFPVAVVTRNTPLRPRGERAVLGVSSFGLSGTNAHSVIGEYVPDREPVANAPEEPADHQGPQLLVLSARTPAALRRLALRHADHLGADGAGRGHALRDICRSAILGRDHHPLRLWAVGSTHDAMAATLRAVAEGSPTPDGGIHDAGFDGPRQVAFVFPGQGSQWRGMGVELLRTSAAFRTAMAGCDAAVRDELGWSVLELLQDENTDVDSAVDVVQPLLWAMEVALAAHWRSLGVDPDVSIGHSMGEVAAACVAGALSVRDAARVICRRSTLMQRLAGRGAMLATELSPQQAHELLAGYGDEVCVAVENSPSATVLAGDPAVIEEIAAELERRQILNRRVKVNVASHSPVMDEIRDELAAGLADLTPTAAHGELFSSVRCAPVEGTALDAGYWVDNLRRPVRFAESVRQLAEARGAVFIEVSPHPVLSQAVEEVQGAAGLDAAVVTTLIRRQSESTAAVRALGRAFALGVAVDWRRWYGASTARVPLPLYSWDAEDFAPEATPTAAGAAEPTRGAERRVRLSRLGLAALGSGVIARGTALVPPVVYFEALAETVRDLVGEGSVELLDVRLGDGLPLLADAAETTLVIQLDELEGEYGFRVEAVSDRSGTRVRCLEGRARAAEQAPAPSTADLDLALTRCVEYVPGAEFYRRAEGRGYSVAPTLRAVQQLWRRDGEAVARLDLPGAGTTGAAGAWEAGLLAMLAAWPSDPTTAYVPVAFDRVLLADAPAGELWSMTRFEPDGDQDTARGDVVLTASDGRVLADFQGMVLFRTAGRQTAPAEAPRVRAAVIELALRQPKTARPKAARPEPVRSATERLTVHVATVLGTTVDRVDLRRSLRELGLDSLMAVQLRRTLQQEFGVEIPTGRLLGDDRLSALATELETAAAEFNEMRAA